MTDSRDPPPPKPAVIALKPKWKPLVAPVPNGNEPLLPITAVDECGVVIVGGSQYVHVFQVFVGQRLWFSIKAHAAIAGYCVSGSNLYVTDGPVLSCWSLEFAFCLAAVNLLTGNHLSGKTQPITPDQLAALHGPPGSAFVRALSAPVARQHELDESPATVFALDSQGTLYAMDDGLDLLAQPSFAAPLEADLQILEQQHPDDPNSFTCFLFYVAADASASIQVINANARPPALLEVWPSWPGFAYGNCMPPTVLGGLVWGAHFVLASTTWAAPPPPGFSPVLQWDGIFGDAMRTLAVSSPEKLALLTRWTGNGAADHQLVTYAANQHKVERWRVYSTTAPVWLMFWPDTSDPVKAPPRLVLELDWNAPAATGSAGYRVYVASTIDVPHEELAWTFPPPPTVLVNGSFVVGVKEWQKILPRIGSILAPPVIVKQEMFLLVGAPGDNVALISCSLTDLAPEARKRGAAELARLAPQVTPIQVKIENLQHLKNDAGAVTDVHVPAANARFALQFDRGDVDPVLPPSPREFTTDADGKAWVDAAFHGLNVGIRETVQDLVTGGDVNRCVLSRDRLNTITIDGFGPVHLKFIVREVHVDNSDPDNVVRTTHDKPFANATLTYKSVVKDDPSTLTTDAGGNALLPPYCDGRDMYLDPNSVHAVFPGGCAWPNGGLMPHADRFNTVIFQLPVIHDGPGPILVKFVTRQTKNGQTTTLPVDNKWVSVELGDAKSFKWVRTDKDGGALVAHGWDNQWINATGDLFKKTARYYGGSCGGTRLHASQDNELVFEMPETWTRY